MSDWINTKDELPEDSRWIVMEVRIPVGNLTLRRITFDLGYYLTDETEVYIDEDEDEELVKVSSYSLGDNGERYIPKGFYRVFTDWEGTHIHQIGGEVTRWKYFL